MERACVVERGVHYGCAMLLVTEMNLSKWALQLLMGLAVTVSGLGQITAATAITNVAGLRRAALAETEVVCDVRFEATVCAASAKGRELIVSDDSGAELIWLEEGTAAIPGQRISVTGASCQLILRDWGISITRLPIIVNDGLHAMTERSGTVSLTPGRIPIRLEWFSGGEERDLGMDAALRMARIIHHDLTLVNASAWQWWMAVANEDCKSGLIYTDYKKPGDAETIYESKLLWALRNYSRFIRPGMVRVELSGPQDVNGLMASAYLDEKNGRKVVVFVYFAYEGKIVHLQSSLAADTETKFTLHLTSADKNLAAGEPVSVAESLSIPARCVMTLVSEPGLIAEKIQATPPARPTGK